MKQYTNVFLVCGLLVALPLISGTSFFTLVLSPFIALFLVAWLVYSGTIIWKRPSQRKGQAIKVFIWATTIALLFGIHDYQAAAAKQEATAILAKILEHKSQRGVYPKELGEIGLNAKELRWNKNIVYGMRDGARPFLAYSSAANPFDRYWYDFESNQWQFHPD